MQWALFDAGGNALEEGFGNKAFSSYEPSKAIVINYSPAFLYRALLKFSSAGERQKQKFGKVGGVHCYAKQTKCNLFKIFYASLLNLLLLVVYEFECPIGKVRFTPELPLGTRCFCTLAVLLSFPKCLVSPAEHQLGYKALLQQPLRHQCSN